MSGEIKVHEFKERFEFSEGIELEPELLEKIADVIPNSTGVERSKLADDKNGTDYWINRADNLPSISIDVKHRSFCPRQRFKSDDACIETTSVYKGRHIRGQICYPWERTKIGWTLDIKKRTDYIVYTWPTDSDGLRYWIVPFHPLCAASMKHWFEWAEKYGERAAPNRGYVTLSVYPPRAVIAQAMAEFMRGEV